MMMMMMMILLCIIHTVITKQYSMSNIQLRWVQLHVSTLCVGNHQVVLRLFKQLYNKRGILGGVWGWFNEAGVVSRLQPGHYSGLPAPNLQPTANQERNDQCDNQHYSRELVMMGIVMPETC